MSIDDEIKKEVREARMAIIDALKASGLFPDDWIYEHFGTSLDVGDRL